MKNIKTMLAISTVMVLCALFYNFGAANNKIETKTETLYQIEPFPYVYFIGDVNCIIPEENEVDVVLPNGEVHIFGMPDEAPEQFSEVIIRCESMDDYDSYKIVGLR